MVHTHGSSSINQHLTLQEVPQACQEKMLHGVIHPTMQAHGSVCHANSIEVRPNTNMTQSKTSKHHSSTTRATGNPRNRGQITPHGSKMMSLSLNSQRSNPVQFPRPEKARTKQSKCVRTRDETMQSGQEYDPSSQQRQLARSQQCQHGP